MHTWRNLTASIWNQPAGRTGIGGILLLSGLATISLCWSPYSPQIISGPPLASPGTSHFLGTNGVGQDVFSQVLEGCRISVVVAITVALAATSIGQFLGAAASYAIVAEVGLSFLGLGDPTLKSWGMMIRQALDYPGLLWTAGWSWWLLPPSIMASLAVFSFTLAGYALDDSLRLQKT